MSEPTFDGKIVHNGKPIKILGAAVGDLANDKIKTCNICKENGFSHEPIVFKKLTGGKVRSDGSYEIEGYQIQNYYTNKQHEHKYQRYYKGWDLGAFFSEA